MDFVLIMFREAWHLLVESSVYVLFGLLVSGLLRVFLSPQSVVRHFGGSRFSSVFKAGLLGIPLPLCSCGVLPAAVSLKKQGASNGAATAFLISTPESGVDSIAITYALLDPIMTVARPVAAFVTSVAAGMLENLFPDRSHRKIEPPDMTCPVDACCDGVDCAEEDHRRHHTAWAKTRAGLVYAAKDLWGDLAGWFLVGLLVAGLIAAAVPEDIMGRYLGGGVHSMLLMLAVGVPMYICATASTPIAAALILKGVSPGAALVFLLAGPATNITSLTVLWGALGKRATVIYVGAIAICAMAFGLILDEVYAAAGVSIQAQVGQAAELVPEWAGWTGAVVLLALSGVPVWGSLRERFHRVVARIPRSDKSKVRRDDVSLSGSSCRTPS